MERLSKKIRNVWVLISLVFGLFIGGITSFVVFQVSRSIILAAMVLVVLLSMLLMYSLLRYRNWSFEVHEDNLEINYGVFRKTSAVVPYVRVQHIDTNRGVLERMLNLASLNVYTAGSRGADMRIPGLPRQRAEEMQEALKSKAIESEKGFDAV